MAPTAKRILITAVLFVMTATPRWAADTDAAEKPLTFQEQLDAAVGKARAGDRETAAVELATMSAAFPTSAVVAYNLALTYEFDADGNRYKSENLNVAASYYLQSLAADPAFSPAHYNLAVVWHKLGYWEEAVREYRLVGEEDSARGKNAVYNSALALRELGRPEEAASLLEKDKSTFDDVARVRLLAVCEEDRGAAGRAIALWKRALALEDKPPYNAVARRHLQTLRGY